MSPGLLLRFFKSLFALLVRNPNVGDLDEEWKPANTSEVIEDVPIRRMEIGKKFKMIDEPFRERLDFLKSLNMSIIN